MYICTWELAGAGAGPGTSMPSLAKVADTSASVAGKPSGQKPSGGKARFRIVEFHRFLIALSVRPDSSTRYMS